MNCLVKNISRYTAGKEIPYFFLGAPWVSKKSIFGPVIIVAREDNREHVYRHGI
jgi:hypothetical protein